MMLYDVDESELLECGMPMYFSPRSVLEVKKRQRVNYVGNVCAQPMEGAEGATATAFARAPGQGESVSHTEKKVKPLWPVTIVKDVRKDETFRDGISRNDTMMSPGWTHSRLRQAAEAAAVLLPRRLALAFSKSSWWRPCHEAKRPRDNGCLTCSPRCFCSILQLKSFYPSFQCDQNWSTIPLWWIRRFTVQKVEHSKHIGTCAYIIIVHMHFIIYIKSYSFCLPVLRVQVYGLAPLGLAVAHLKSLERFVFGSA